MGRLQCIRTLHGKFPGAAETGGIRPRGSEAEAEPMMISDTVVGFGAIPRHHIAEQRGLFSAKGDGQRQLV